MASRLELNRAHSDWWILNTPQCADSRHYPDTPSPQSRYLQSSSKADHQVGSGPYLAPLLGICSDENICRRLALHWGVSPIQIEERETHDWKALCKTIFKRGSIERFGSTVLLVSGFNDDPQLNEPVMKIIRL